MKPMQILRAAHTAGLTVSLAKTPGNLFVHPVGHLTPELRAMLIEFKVETVGFLHDARQTTAALIAAAMRVCDQHGDNEAAREEMRQDCLKLPPHLQQDLLRHFNDRPAAASAQRRETPTKN